MDNNTIKEAVSNHEVYCRCRVNDLRKGQLRLIKSFSYININEYDLILNKRMSNKYLKFHDNNKRKY